MWNLTSSTDKTHYTWLDSQIYENFGSTTRKLVGNPTPLLTSWRVYNVSSKASLWQVRLDNQQIYTTATNTVGMDASALTLGFALAGVTEIYIGGYIAFFALYSRALTAYERNALTAYCEKRLIPVSS